MGSKIFFLIIGSILTLSLVYLADLFKKEDVLTETYIPQFVTNQETGASGRLMEADIIYYDTDNDGKEENIILYSCNGCNAPPRELAIIDDGELTFSYEGANLKFIPIEPGAFTIDEANVPRDGRRIETNYFYDELTGRYAILNEG
jgi:hypothetical protein